MIHLIAAALISLFASPATPCRGDLNGDGRVNIADAALLAPFFAQPPAAYDPRFDLNGDGRIGLQDVVSLIPLLGPCPVVGDPWSATPKP